MSHEYMNEGQHPRRGPGRNMRRRGGPRNNADFMGQPVSKRGEGHHHHDPSGHHDDHESRGSHHGRGSRHFGPGGHRGGAGRGPGERHGGRGRARGDVKAAILTLLSEQPRHGYEIIREIETRSGGSWVPSPGSIYPHLQALEDQGLITVETVEGRRTASLTDDGRTHVSEHGLSLDKLFAEQVAGPRSQVRAALAELNEAVRHVARQSGTSEDAQKLVDIITTARKDVYRLLAE